MLNLFAKILLAATSMSPILGAVAVNQIAQGEPWTRWTPWFAAALGLVLLCWLMLKLVRGAGERHAFQIEQFESTDREVLVFLLTYLLPFIASKKLDFTGEWLTGAYILLVILFTVAHAGAFHFNPVMGLFGYHFYAVRETGGISSLLISKKPMRRPGEVQVVTLAEGIYLSRE